MEQCTRFGKGGLLFALLAVLFPAVAQMPGVSFTESGYDVDGGTDPICWRMTWWPASDYLDFQNFRMMSHCFNGTNLDVAPLDLDKDENVQVMHTNKTYSFQITFRADYNAIAEDFKKLMLGFTGNVEIGNRTSTTLLFRMILCDTTQIGFCNPLALGGPDDTNSSELQDIEEWLSDVRQDEVLEGKKIGNHIFSPWLNMTLNETSPFNYYMNTTIRMNLPTGQRGAFFVIGHGHLQAHFKAENKTDEFLTALNWVQDIIEEVNSEPQVTTMSMGRDKNETNSTIEEAFLWVEIADAVPNNVVDVRPPPNIMVVSDGMKIGVGVVSGVFALFSLINFLFIVRHRNHMVMKLAQWPFLLWMVFCCLWSNVFAFTYMPTKDWHCRWSDMLEFIPLTMIGCILVGRTWRVYLTVSSAMNIGLKPKSDTETGTSDYIERYCVGLLTIVAKFPYNCRMSDMKEQMSGKNSDGARGFRKQVTGWETTRLILWISLPQIILQVTGVIVYDKFVETNYDQMMTEGREVCSESGQWMRRVGLILVATAYATAVLLAWLSRELPSAFNETDGIFQSATINSIVGLLTLSLDQIASVSRTSPDVTVFLWVATSLIVTTTTLGFVVIPKVRRVMSGEEIIISNLLAQNRTSSAFSTMANGLPGGAARRSSHLSPENRSIHLQQNQPIPKGLEKNLLGANQLIVGVTNELVQGRTPKLNEWNQLIGTVDELHDTFERIEFEWTEEDEQEA